MTQYYIIPNRVIIYNKETEVGAETVPSRARAGWLNIELVRRTPQKERKRERKNYNSIISLDAAQKDLDMVDCPNVV